MADINMDAIMKKVKAFEKSKVGQQRIEEEQNKKKVRSIVKSGVRSEKDCIKVAKEYLKFLNSTVQSDNKASSALKTIMKDATSSAKISQPVQIGKGTYQVDINFDKESLRRESLLVKRKDGIAYYTGEGINNIIALFNNGMDIDGSKSVPGGEWVSHGYTVRATAHRDPLKFMQKSASDFKASKGKTYGIKQINLDEIYKE